jgi:hypothetical protein
MQFNELVLSLLEGPAYRLLPSGLTEISYTGPTSGRAIRLPAHSVRHGSRFLVVASRPYLVAHPGSRRGIGPERVRLLR